MRDPEVHVEFKTDSSGQRYVEIGVHGTDEHIRFTHLPTGGYGRNSIRVQIRDAQGHLRPGPELPAEQLWECVGVMMTLATPS